VTPVLASTGALLLAIFTWRILSRLERYILFLEGSLDAVPQPLTVTDLDMRWVFVNKATEGLLRRTRHEVEGRHCSEWQAHICNTDKCGIHSLRQGHPRTNYQQNMGDGTHRAMQVDTTYIVDSKGQRMGHIEIVTDVQVQNELSGLHARLASSLEEMTSTMTEIDSQTRTNAGYAAEASKLAAATRQTLSTQNGEIRNLSRAMAAINERSQQITRINKVVDEIAFQTNILALNAAVEAARAGEAGAGFAVVADEVRNLASRASEAAKQTSTLIGETAQAVQDGNVLASRVADSLSEIDSKAENVERVVEHIARSSAEQSVGISAVASALTDLGRVAVDSAGRSPADSLVQISR
jgi:PAS domain S-box-containing protein